MYPSSDFNLDFYTNATDLGHLVNYVDTWRGGGGGGDWGGEDGDGGCDGDEEGAGTSGTKGHGSSGTKSTEGTGIPGGGLVAARVAERRADATDPTAAWTR
jgi:hypothetical protein